MSPPLILLIFTQKKVFHEADHGAQIRFSPHKADYMKKMRKTGSQREKIAAKSRECQFWISNVHKISFLCAISSRRETVFYIFCVYSVITSTIFGFQHFSYLCQDISDS